MKSKLKTKIDLTEVDDLNVCICVTDFLLALGLNSAEAVLVDFTEIQEDDFCSSCEAHKDNCECSSNYNDYDYDRDYDSWKDSQLEEKVDAESSKD